MTIGWGDLAKICALIPARAGSKGVPGKNIYSLGGHPVLAYSIAVAKQCPEIERVIVSTDSEVYAQIATAYGAEVPFLRPKEFSEDFSIDRDVVIQFLDWCCDSGSSEPEVIMYLRPTTPLRQPDKLSEALSIIGKESRFTSLRSAHEISEPPQKMYKLGAEGVWEGFFPDDPRPEYFNLPRQMFPTAYHPNGYVDILKKSILRTGAQFYGDSIASYITPHAVEIDQPEDLEYLDYVISHRDGDDLVRHLNSHFKSNFGYV